jgi:hypothetical protein
MPSLRRTVLALLWYGLLLVLSVNCTYLLSRGEPLTVRKSLQLEGIQDRAEVVARGIVGRLRAKVKLERGSPPDGSTAGTGRHGTGRPDTGNVGAGHSSTKPSPGEKAFKNEPGRSKPEKGLRALPSVNERPGEYEQLFDWAARRYGVEKRLIKAVIQAESAGNPRARSHKGALGLMQLMPQTAQRYFDGGSDLRNVEDLYLPVTNVSVGASHLAWLKAQVRTLFPEARRDPKRQVQLVAAAYNAGLSDVQRYRGVPPYPETEAYIRRVWHFYQRLPPGPDAR